MSGFPPEHFAGQRNIMKKIAVVFSFLVINLGLLSMSAAADTLTLESTGGQSVDGVYVYPYNFSIDGSPSTTPLMCLDFNREITQGETWNVTETGIPAGNINYEAEAIISYVMAQATTPQQISDAQFAAWYIFDPTGSSTGFTSAAISLADTAVADATSGNLSSLPGFSYSNYTLYIPTSDTTGWTDGQPQEFIGNTPAVPEPSSLALLGTGIVGMAGQLRRIAVPALVRVTR
jgi:hypothetical protein